MQVLVTGASGFIGRAVVAALQRRGHDVCALVRSPEAAHALRHDPRVSESEGPPITTIQADLEQPSSRFDESFKGIDAVIHLAGRLTGTDEAKYRAAVTGTQRLLEALTRSNVRHLVLASSFSVYDWSRIETTVDEQSPTLSESAAAKVDGYARAKTAQESLVRQAASIYNWRLTVMRPGMVWGADQLALPTIGQRAGPMQVIFGPKAPSALTHVSNCAEAFASAVEQVPESAATFNVVDGHRVSRWRLAGDLRAWGGLQGVRVPVPYQLGLAGARVAAACHRSLLNGRVRLPGVANPVTYEARFKRVSALNDKLRQVLNWQPRPYAQCLKLTFAAENGLDT